MTPEVKPLDFSVVDGLGFAATNGHLKTRKPLALYEPKRLGPLFELLHLSSGKRLPDPVGNSWLVPNGTAPLIKALRDRRESWLSNGDRRMGFIHAQRNGPDGDNRLSAFLMDAQRAAREVSGLKGSVPGQLAAAMEELEGNIHEHSLAADTGIIAFRAARDVFEFIAADRGIGILRSLQRCNDFATLPDEGKALQTALDEGTSRYGIEAGRGHGFRPIFVGLANLNGALRFRSGDHALLMDGTNRELATAQLAQKPFIDGFFVSVAIFS